MEVTWKNRTNATGCISQEILANRACHFTCYSPWGILGMSTINGGTDGVCWRELPIYSLYNKVDDPLNIVLLSSLHPVMACHGIWWFKDIILQPKISSKSQGVKRGRCIMLGFSILNIEQDEKPLPMMYKVSFSLPNILGSIYKLFSPSHSQTWQI